MQALARGGARASDRLHSPAPCEPLSDHDARSHGNPVLHRPAPTADTQHQLNAEDQAD
jgi:hypothetical protein